MLRSHFGNFDKITNQEFKQIKPDDKGTYVTHIDDGTENKTLIYHNGTVLKWGEFAKFPFQHTDTH